MKKGKFWPLIRELTWQKAEQLFMQDQILKMNCDIKPERRELREEGYYHTAKLIVLREINEGKIHGDL